MITTTQTKPEESIAKGGVRCPFPWKIHDMLAAVEEEGLEHIVSWQPHGRAFIVKKTSVFVEQVLPRFFAQTKWPSFQRQLNLYGFHRFAHGKDKGAYYHHCFVRGKRSLVRGMIRRKIKGTKVRRTMKPSEEPDFYSATGDGEVSPSGGGDVAAASLEIASCNRKETNKNSCKKSSILSPVTTLLPAGVIPEGFQIPEPASVDFPSDHSLANNPLDLTDCEALDNFDFLFDADLAGGTSSATPTWNNNLSSSSSSAGSVVMFPI